MSLKSICFIPARGGSKGILMKNIRKLGNKPLIAHTIESAIESKIFSHVIVSTENKEIAEIAKQYGAEVPFLRPEELANDEATTDSVLIHGITTLRKMNYEFDILMLRDCTVPFISAQDMAGCIEKLTKNNCDGVFASIRAHPNPYFGMLELNSEGFLQVTKSTGKSITRRQNAPLVYICDGMYAHWADDLIKNHGQYEAKNIPFEISKEHGHMIDSEYDFKLAELILDFKTKNNLKNIVD